MIDLVGLRGMFLIDAGLALLGGLILTFLMPDVPRTERKSSLLARTGETLAMVWQRPALRWNFICLFLSIGSRAVVEVYLPVRITEIAEDPAPMIGLILGVTGLVTAVATVASSKLVDEHGGMRWFMPLMLVGTVSTAGLAVIDDVWLMLVLSCIRALPFAAAATILVSHLTRVVPARRADGRAVADPAPTERRDVRHPDPRRRPGAVRGRHRARGRSAGLRGGGGDRLARGPRHPGRAGRPGSARGGATAGRHGGRVVSAEP